MARKGQASIQDTLETNEDFETYLNNNYDRLICLEVYAEFCGYCLAMSGAVRKAKLEIGGDRIAMAKAPADNIEALIRFKGKSEPCFLFISKGMLTRAVFGSNGIELCNVVEEELGAQKREEETGVPRLRLDIREMLPEEAVKIEASRKLEAEYREAVEQHRIVTQAARKRRVCERLSVEVKRLNYIMFWPHCHQAHYDLYENWDKISIQVQAKDTFQLTEEMAREALYMSDIESNEACLHALITGEALVVLFKMFDTDNRDFVKLLRYSLYEEIPVPKEDVAPEKQIPPFPAFERYATISKSKKEVRRERYEAKMQRMREEREDRERLAAEMARLAREEAAEKEAAAAEAALLAPPLPVKVEVKEEEEVEGEGEGGEIEGAGDAEAEETTEPDDETALQTEPTGSQEQVEEQAVEEQEEEFHSDVSIEDEEYIPPGGLFVPGLYSPSNELAKSNGLALFFPKIVEQLTTIESEYLPPHVLVMFNIDKRQEVSDIIQLYRDEILSIGIFVGEEPTSLEHLAFSIKQYNKMIRIRKHKDRLALMVSRKRSLPLLQLAGVGPCYISADVNSGERDCLTLFPVGYGDEFEEEETVLEEEIQEEIVAVPEDVPDVEAVVPETVEGEEDEDEDD